MSSAARPAARRIESPCVGVCQLDGSDHCVGCARHRDEIGAWTLYSHEQRAEIMTALPERWTRLYGAVHRPDGG